jgi:hypothetical protein
MILNLIVTCVHVLRNSLPGKVSRKFESGRVGKSLMFQTKGEETDTAKSWKNWKMPRR